jgi:uncharacterized protein (DUF111 family)
MVGTPYGPVSVKVGQWRGRVTQISPEYESCRQLARRCGVPLKDVYQAAEAQARADLKAYGQLRGAQEER